MRYERFILGNLFTIEGTTSLDAGSLTFIEEGINFVGRVDENNGVQGKIGKQNFEPNSANTITATVIGNYKYVKYQQEPYYCSQNINKLTPKFEMNEKLALYFVTVIGKFVALYNGQQGGYKLNQLKEFMCNLPIKTDENGNPIIDDTCFFHNEGFVPNFEYMQKFIEELKQKYIQELNQYLITTELNNYILTDDDNEHLSSFESYKESDKESFAKICHKEFKICDVFKIKNSKNILKSDVDFTNPKHPYVTAQEGNNSIMGYVNYDESYLDKGGCIFIGGKTLVISYQAEDFFSNDSHNLLLYPKEWLSENTCEYMITSLYKSLKPKYNWNDSISYKKIQSDIFSLPIQTDSNNNPVIDDTCKYHPDGYIPNWDFMDKYIKSIEKIVIADVVKFKDAVIDKNRKAVNG